MRQIIITAAIALGLVALWAAILPLTAEPAPATTAMSSPAMSKALFLCRGPNGIDRCLHRRAGQGAGPRRLQRHSDPRQRPPLPHRPRDARHARPPRLTVQKTRGRPAHAASEHPAAASRRVRHGATGHCHSGDLAALPGNRRADLPRTRRCRHRHDVLPARRASVARGGPRRHDQLETARRDRRHDLRAVPRDRDRAHRTHAARAGPDAGARRAVPVRAAIHRAVVHRADLDRARQCRGCGLRRDRFEP